MNTRLLMISSYVLMGLTGISLIFSADDIAELMNPTQSLLIKTILQLMGALYLGFAMLNKMAQGALIGGIFAKPISMANSVHFFIGAMALLKVCIRTTDMPLLWVVFGIYALYAACFLYVAFTAPKEKKAAV